MNQFLANFLDKEIVKQHILSIAINSNYNKNKAITSKYYYKHSIQQLSDIEFVIKK